MKVKTPADLGPIVNSLLKDRPRIIALVGPLGAGKTTLTQRIAKELGVPNQVVSPTYVLQQIYSANHPQYTTLVHIDAYRLTGEHELPALDLVHWAQQPKVLIVIEWADRIKKFLQSYSPMWVNIAHLPDGGREIIVS